MTDKEQLAALRQLEESLEKLEGLALTWWNDKRITAEDEEQYDRLLRESQRLYGRLKHVIGAPLYQIAGRSFDGFQHVLSVPSLSNLLNDQTFALLWQQCMSGVLSGVRQTFGAVEEAERRGQLAVSPEAVARWMWLIRPLERVRRVVAAHPRFLNPLLQRVEGWPMYRLIAIIGTVVAFIAGIIVLVALFT